MALDLDRQQEAFDALRAEWSALVQMPRALQASAWTQSFVAMYEEQEQLIADGRWTVGAHDLLEIIGHERRETTHCRVLAWLCNARAPHGLGSGFLLGLLEAAGHDVSTESVRGARAEVEVARAHSRIDILVRSPSLTLVVEAKVDADERCDQCDDIFRDWRDEPGARFIFLTPDGRVPETARGEAADAFRAVGFRPLGELLQRLVAAPPPGEPRRPEADHALKTYLATLRREFA